MLIPIERDRTCIRFAMCRATRNHRNGESHCCQTETFCHEWLQAQRVHVSVSFLKLKGWFEIPVARGGFSNNAKYGDQSAKEKAHETASFCDWTQRYLAPMIAIGRSNYLILDRNSATRACRPLA